MRYEDCKQDAYDILDKEIMVHFPELDNVKFKCVFDSKAKKKGGRYVIAQIKKVNDLVEFLASDNFNYLILIDKNIWEAIEDEKDKYRIIRHELHHVMIDNEAMNPYKLKDHDIEDFISMVEDEVQNGDPRWAQRIAVIAESIYDKENEEG
jgi:hypothetical protein